MMSMNSSRLQTVAAISSFYLAMALFPEVQKKAQDELDRVIGRERLPRMKDREDLPYIEAVIKETLRWRPVAPTGKISKSLHTTSA